MLASVDDDHRVELQVFVQSGCDRCGRAEQLARDTAGDYP